MRILVTGGAGFIGSHIAEYFQDKADVRVLDNLSSGSMENIKGLDVEFIEGSITDKDTVSKAVKDMHYIFHLAALTSVPESIEKPNDYYNINTQGLLNVLEVATPEAVLKLIFSSSAAVYGDEPGLPKVETMSPAPQSPYAETKLAGEILCNSFEVTGKILSTCFRYFNVFGPRQNPESAYAAAIPIFITKALNNEPLTIYGDGEQTRDFIFVKDIAATCAAVLREPDITGVYNLASGKSITINKLAELIIKETNSSSSIEYKPARPGDIIHSSASIEKISSACKVTSTDFESAIKETIKSFSSS